MKSRLTEFLFAIILLGGCQGLDDAKLAQRNTFMHFYEGAYSLSAATAEVTSDGFIIAGTVHASGSTRASRIVVIKTDQFGQTNWQTVIDHGTATTVLPVSDGYIVIGDSVVYSPNATDISELENHRSRLIKLNLNGDIVYDVSSLKQRNTNQQHIDYYTNGMTLDNQGNLIILGVYHSPGENKHAYVSAIHSSGMDTLWHRTYSYVVRDYVNTRAVHFDGGKIIWGTSITETVNSFNYSYLAIPVVMEQSTFLNNNYFGQNQEQQSLRIRDLQKATSGYAAIGTYSKPDGSNADPFFIRVDRNGNFIENSIRYFDAFAGASPAGVQPSFSDVSESGDAIAATRDGGFIIAGTLATDDGKGIGNGGKDIWLIKTDAFGNPLWNRIIGGSTNETVSSIRETADGGLLICGTVQDGSEQSGGLSSIFLIKTDRNGELKN